MIHRQPPLYSLRTFSAVMRHQSIKLAAQELCITPQAASYQIKQLENALGHTLFERLPRGVLATDAARRLIKHVNKAFGAIDEGMRELEQHDCSHKLYLHVSPYFASNHLIPHLNSFTTLHPETDLRISIGADLVDFSEKGLDMAIHWGYGGITGYTEIPLINDIKVLVCRPELLLANPINCGDDLLKQNLICPLVKNTLWADTLALLGKAGCTPQNEIRLHTNDAMLEAALAGMGVALVSYADAIREIRSGKLVAPLGEHLLEGLAPERTPKFFILLPQDKRHRPPIVEVFYGWLRSLLHNQPGLVHPSALLPAKP